MTRQQIRAELLTMAPMTTACICGFFVCCRDAEHYSIRKNGVNSVETDLDTFTGMLRIVHERAMNDHAAHPMLGRHDTGNPAYDHDYD